MFIELTKYKNEADTQSPRILINTDHINNVFTIKFKNGDNVTYVVTSNGLTYEVTETFDKIKSKLTGFWR